MFSLVTCIKVVCNWTSSSSTQLLTCDQQQLMWHIFRKFLFHHFQPFQLLEYQWREGKFDKQTSSKPPTLLTSVWLRQPQCFQPQFNFFHSFPRSKFFFTRGLFWEFTTVAHLQAISYTDTLAPANYVSRWFRRRRNENKLALFVVSEKQKKKKVLPFSPDKVWYLVGN